MMTEVAEAPSPNQSAACGDSLQLWGASSRTAANGRLRPDVVLVLVAQRALRCCQKAWRSHKAVRPPLNRDQSFHYLHMASFLLHMI